METRIIQELIILYEILFLVQKPPVDQGLLIHEVSRKHTMMHHSR
jgi:hypothetical protein